MTDQLVFWVTGFVPVILGAIGLFVQHVIKDHRVELDTKTKQAYIEGMTHGLNARISQLEDFRDTFLKTGD